MQTSKSWLQCMSNTLHFFSVFIIASGIPTCYTVSAIHGFVEELVVNDDPEYQVNYM